MFRIAFAGAALSAMMSTAALAQDAPADSGPATPPPAVAPMQGGSTMEGPQTSAEAVGQWGPADFGAVSADRLIGVDLVNYNDETVATIDDVIITNDNQVDGIVVTFGGLLGFGSQKVLLQPTEVEVMRDEGDTLRARTSLTPEAIESRPTYEES